MQASQRLSSYARRQGIAHLLEYAFEPAPRRVQFIERLKARGLRLSLPELTDQVRKSLAAVPVLRPDINE